MSQRSITSDNQTMTSIAIIADASSEMGIGHVMRCFAVAEILIECGVQVTFISEGIPHSVRTKLINARIKVQDCDSEHPATYYVQSGTYSAALVDGYHFGSEIGEVVKSKNLIMANFDDMYQKTSRLADIIINTSSNAKAEPYREMGCDADLLLGSGYHPFRSDFHLALKSHISTAASNSEDSRRILINFGGSDPHNMGRRIARLIATDIPSAEIHLVTGPGAPHEVGVPEPENMREHYDVQDMASLISSCRLSISAGGGTIAELALMKIPTILVVTDKNQEPAARSSWCKVLYAPAGQFDDFENALKRATRDLWENPSKRSKLLDKIDKNLDSKGARRIAEALLAKIEARNG